MNHRFSLLLTSFLILSTLPLLADVLILQGGRKVEGTFLRADSRTMRFLGEDGQVENFPISDLTTLIFGNQKVATPASPPTLPSDSYTVPKGTVLVVRMIDSVDSDLNKQGDSFRATLEEPVTLSGRTLAPKGSAATVELVHLKQSGKLRGQEEIALQLHSIRVNDKTYPLTSQFAQLASEGKGKQTAKVVGGTTAIGALIGAITGGKKGAAVGAAAGAGAGTAIQLARGQQVRVSSEALLTFTLDESLALEAKRPGVDKAQEDELQVAKGRAFGKRQEEIIRDWFSNQRHRQNLPPGLAKGNQLPPGLEQHMRKNGALPPGLQRHLQPLPKSLVRLLPRVPGQVGRGVIGPHVVLLEIGTNRILDILADVIF